jgi:uncharacterized protein YhfF
VTAAAEDWRSLERFAFGDGPEMADRLLGFVLAGAKTATCWSTADGQQTHVGKQMVVLDGAGRPRAVIETVSLEQMRFCDVPWSFAQSEGEGDECLDDWRAGHEAYFTRNGGFDPEMMLWCERFRLVRLLPPGESTGDAGEGDYLSAEAPSTAARSPSPCGGGTGDVAPLRESSGEAGEGASSTEPTLKPPPALRATSPCGGGTEEIQR